MPFCASCGSAVEGRFCPKCGSAVAGGAQPAPGAPMGASTVPPVQTGAAVPMADNVASMLCYILGFITGILFLVIQPYNRNPVVRFHAFQSIFLSVACIAISWALSILFLTISWTLLSLFMLVRLAMFLFWLYMLLMTYQGKTIVLPIIGPLAQQQSRV
jgi:uncharacterized membrane protein